MGKLKETLKSLSKTVFEKQFRVDYKKLNTETQKEAAEAITELVEEYRTHPWDHPQVKYIPSNGEIWRLKIGNRGQKVDHRIFFDLNDQILVFLTINHREQAYQ